MKGLKRKVEVLTVQITHLIVVLSTDPVMAINIVCPSNTSYLR